MPIDTSKLVFAPMLQDPLIGTQADLLINGTITFYSNTNRQTLKNVYYQSGTVAPYSYIALPNPMTLSASGTLVDGNGNDVIPGWYPYSETDNLTEETYFIVVQNSDGTEIFSRYNFPVNIENVSPTTGNEADVNNLIVNSRFWRNVGTTGNINAQLSTVVCPSIHDGFIDYVSETSPSAYNRYMRDIAFNKNAAGSTDVITFTPFSIDEAPQILKDVQPEYYLNSQCTGGGGGETLKYFQFPITLHLLNLFSRQVVVSIQAKDENNSGAALRFYWYQFQGTGQVSATPEPFHTQALTGSWEKYNIESQIPAITDLTFEAGPGDDALYLWIAVPPNVTYNISFCLPSVYLIEHERDVPENDFSNYDEINAIISSPRTGDVRTSLNSFQPWGWAPMNGGTIGQSTANPTIFGSSPPSALCRATWPLYSMLWNAFSPFGASVFPIYTNATPPVLSTYGTTAISDWAASKAIAITQTMGRVIMGTQSFSQLLDTTATIPGDKSTFNGSDNGGKILIATTGGYPMRIYRGMCVVFTEVNGSVLDHALSPNTPYYITADSAYNEANGYFHVSETFALAMAGTALAWSNPVGVGNCYVSKAPNSLSGGEYAHIQLEGEIATHTHTNTVATSVAGSVGTSSILGSNGNTPTVITNNPVITIANNGSSTPFNVTQPSTFMNMFIKL